MWILLRLTVVAFFISGKLPHPGIALLEVLDVPLTESLKSGSSSVFYFMLQSIHYLTGIGLYLCFAIMAEVVLYQLSGPKQRKTKECGHG